MTQAVDIQQVIEKSTSEVSLKDLTRKGFKQVKVLNQAAITKLIAQAVDRVMEGRAAEISEQERERVIEQSQRQFDDMARERMQEHGAAERLRAEKESLGEKYASLTEEADLLRQRLSAALEVQVERDQAIEQQRHLEKRVEELTSSLASKDEERTASSVELQARVEELTSSLASKDEEHAAACAKLEARVEELTASLTAKSDEQDASRSSLEARVAELTESLSSKSEEHAASSAKLEARVEELTSSLSSKDEKLVATQDRLESAEAELTSSRARLEQAGEAGETAVELRRELGTLQDRLASTEKAAAICEGMLAAKEQELERLRVSRDELVERVSATLGKRLASSRGDSSPDLSAEIKESLAGIQEKIRNITTGSVAVRKGEEHDIEALVKFAEMGADDVALDTNVGEVGVKESKAKGVNSTLAKLRQLQQGAKGTDDGDQS